MRPPGDDNPTRARHERPRIHAWASAPAPRSTSSAPHARAFTLLEMLFTTAMLAGLFGALVVVSNSLRADNAQQQTQRTLALLRRALLSYHAEQRTWPAAEAALDDLRRHPPAAALLAAVALHTDTRGKPAVHDGYGRPVRYLPPTPPHLPEPDFVSAGPDGLFGDLTSQLPEHRRAASDNIFGRDVEHFQP